MERISLNKLGDLQGDVLKNLDQAIIITNGQKQKAVAVLVNPEEYLYLLALKQSQLQITLQYGLDMFEVQQIADAQEKIGELNSVLLPSYTSVSSDK